MSGAICTLEYSIESERDQWSLAASISVSYAIGQNVARGPPMAPLHSLIKTTNYLNKQDCCTICFINLAVFPHENWKK